MTQHVHRLTCQCFSGLAIVLNFNKRKVTLKCCTTHIANGVTNSRRSLQSCSPVDMQNWVTSPHNDLAVFGFMVSGNRTLN